MWVVRTELVMVELLGSPRSVCQYVRSLGNPTVGDFSHAGGQDQNRNGRIIGKPSRDVLHTRMHVRPAPGTPGTTRVTPGIQAGTPGTPECMPGVPPGTPGTTPGTPGATVVTTSKPPGSQMRNYFYGLRTFGRRC